MYQQNNYINQPQAPSVPSSRFRIRILQILLLILFFAVALRLVQIQIIEFEKYRETARNQHILKKILPAERGTFFDRYGYPITSNTKKVSIAVDPLMAKDSAYKIAKTLSVIFKKPAKYFLKKIKSPGRFTWLIKNVDIQYRDSVESKKLKGIIVKTEPRRLQYDDQIAGQLIGTTDYKNSGNSGLEQYYNKELSGKDGYAIYERIGKIKILPSIDYPRQEPIHGNNIYLTIDLRLQAIAEKELSKGAKKTNARGGIAIIMHTETGEILALAQYPQINPDTFGESDLEDQRLRAVTDIFEPGSVFKIVVASAALENNLVSPKRVFNAENGIYRVNVGNSSRIIRDIEKAEKYSFEDAIKYSSNIVMARISDIVGNNLFYKMARDYGFGTKTNIDFPGEVNGILRKPKEWSGTTRNTLAYGYEVSVTPIQLACAYAAIANKGKLMQPYLLKKITDHSGNLLHQSSPRFIRKVISESTAEKLTNMLERVVEGGTGENAKLPNIRIAGKTGTSKKIVDGSYFNNKYTASFVGFFPVENPKIVCLVIIDEPSGDEIYASKVSAPIFRAIAEQIINLTDYFTLPIKSLITVNQNKNTTREVESVPENNQNRVPNVCGLSIRRAIDVLTAYKLKPRISGSGTVVSQIPPPGAKINKDRTVKIICENKIAAAIGFR